MNKCENYTPATISELAKLMLLREPDLPKEEAVGIVEEFFNRQFGGYEAYKAACASKVGLDAVLDRLHDEPIE